MKPRHAAALALVGWYLMCPPQTNEHAPLSQWGLLEVYDRASECKQTRDDNIRAAIDDALHNLQKYGVKYEGKVKELSEKEIAMEQACRCLASDDPRLKPK